MMNRTRSDECEQILAIEAKGAAKPSQSAMSLSQAADLRALSEQDEVLTRLVLFVADVHSTGVNDAFSLRSEGLR